MKLNEKFLLAGGLAATLVGAFVFTKIYIHEKDRKELREIAREIAVTWQKKLGLTPIQTFNLEDIIITFTLKKNKIINTNEAEARKIKKLQKVQSREHKKLKKVFSEEQFNTYRGINKTMPNNLTDSLSVI